MMPIPIEYWLHLQVNANVNKLILKKFLEIKYVLVLTDTKSFKEFAEKTAKIVPLTE